MNAWKNGFLLACLIALALGEIGACLAFASNSLDFITRNHNAQAARFSRSRPLELPAILRFGSGQMDARKFGDGWNPPEPAGAWSARNDAWILIDLVPKVSNVWLRLDASVFTSIGSSRNRIDVSVNGTLLASLDRTSANADEPIEVRIPGALVQSGQLDLKLHVDRCVSPLRERSGMDPGWRGVLLKAIEVRSQHEPDRQ